MTFSEECKQELLEEDVPRHPCCRHAMVAGLLFCADTADGVFRHTYAGDAIGQRVEAFLQKELRTEVSGEHFYRVGRPYIRLTLYSRRLLSLLQRANISDLPLSRLLGFECEHCLRYFLRGIFVAVGSVTDLQKSYHMEFSCGDSTTAHRVRELLSQIAAPPATVHRKDGTHLYYKSSAAMEDVFSYLHARRALFALINIKIERDIRNQENRATNCVAQNIQKAVHAATQQTEAIEALRATPAWDMLPKSLRDTAQLRLEFPDATLAELASRHNPPITKSGLNHRLQKLAALAAEQSTKQGTPSR